MLKRKRLFSIMLSLFLFFFGLAGWRFRTEAAELGGIWDGKAYYLVNCYSGKALQVDGGVDANNRNVNQYTKGTQTKQQFKLVYNVAADAYKLYAMCSSSGGNRVLDVERNSNNAIAANCNVQIWTPDDHPTQFFQFQFYGSGYYYIALESNPNLVLTVYDSANGTASGRTATSAGNVFVATKRTSSSGASAAEINKQLWKLISVNAGRSINDGIYEVKADFSGKYLTIASDNNVYQGNRVQTSNQYFKIEYVSDGYYHISTVLSSGNRVTVGSGNNIVMSAPLASGSDTSQLFRIIPCGNNQYRIIGKYGHENFRGLDVEQGSTENGANVIYYRYLGNPCQKWSFNLIQSISLQDQCANMGWDYIFAESTIMNKITNEYNHPAHRGIDIVARISGNTLGKPILSPTSGTVLYVNKNYDANTKKPDQGYCVAIQTNNISPVTNQPIIVTFMHLNAPPALNEDDTISKGDLIGYVGETGYVIGGAHLHLETHSSGKWYSAVNETIVYPTIDPKYFFPNITFVY